MTEVPITRICWKSEDEVDGIACGPVFTQSCGPDQPWYTATMQRYPQGADEVQWYLKPEAMKIAENLGVPFQEV